MVRHRIIFYKVGDIWETLLQRKSSEQTRWVQQDIINEANYGKMVMQQANRGWIDIINNSENIS